MAIESSPMRVDLQRVIEAVMTMVAEYRKGPDE
jgi:hypothetical protein